MVGLLDFLNSPDATVGILNGGNVPNYAALNPDAGDTDALAKALAGDPYKNLDKKQKEEAARKAALSALDPGGPAAVPPAAVGISGQQAMNVGPFGALSPVMPPPPAAPALPPVVADSNAAIVPTLQPRPAAAPSATPAEAPSAPLDISPNVANANAGPAPAVPQASLLGRIGQGVKDFGDGVGNHTAMLLALAGGLAGAPSWGTGISRGLTGAAAALPVDQKMAGQNATVSALMARGMPRDLATVAATNPTALQQVLPQMFGAKQRKFTQIGEDMMGNKTFGFVDETSGKTYDAMGKEITGGSHGGGVAGIPMGPDGNPVTGPALLQHLEKTDPATAAGVKGLISGDLNAQGRNLQKLAPLAKLIDPTFDATQYPVRLKTRESYTSGKDFQETQALNTVAKHLHDLKDSAEGLGNSSVPIFNKAQNWFSDNFTGSPPLVKFRNDLVTASNELAKAYHGGHVSDSAYAAFNKAVNESQTPAEMKAAIGELGSLLQSKIEAKESGYRSSMANAPLPSEYTAINDQARKRFQDINDWANGRAQTSVAPVKVNSPAEAAKLPKGTRFVDPNGVERVVP